MAVSYQQEDTSARCAGLIGTKRDADNGGTAGSSPVTVNLSASSTVSVFFNIAPGLTSWASGNYTARLNVTTANMNLSVQTVNITRYASTCSTGGLLATLGSSNPATSLGATGVLSWTIAGSSQTPSATDILVVEILVANGAMSAQSFAFTPNQLIDTPFTLPQDTGTLTASGTGALSGVGASTGAGALSSSGAGALNGVGTGIVSASLSASGAGALNAVGQTITIASGALSSAGAGALAATGTGVTSASLSASGVGALSGVGASTAATALSAAGVGALNGVGTGIKSSTASASGIGALSGVGTGIKPASLSASGVGALNGVGTAITTAAGALSASGVGALSGAGAAIGSGVLSASAAGALNATGEAVSSGTTDGVLTASGSGSLVAVGETIGTLSNVGKTRRSPILFRGKRYDPVKDRIKLAFALKDWLDEKKKAPLPEKPKKQVKVNAEKQTIVLPQVVLDEPEQQDFRQIAEALRLSQQAIDRYLAEQAIQMEDDEDAITALLLAA